jgi:predicted ATPase
MSAGARFVRVDLHVHTRPDAGAGIATPEQYVEAALKSDLAVMAITDHNAVDGAPLIMEAAKGTGLLVLPGVEISTNEGHLLAIFAPEAMDGLRDFASHGNLQMSPDPRDGALRTSRSMVQLVKEICERGGLAIPAHVDAKNGIQNAMSSRALASLLSSPALSALEFVDRDALHHWFTEDGEDTARAEARRARDATEELRERGLARVMSSDAHTPDKVGGDRPSRTMTRLRLDEPTFEAVRNALVNNPKARCKAEVDLPQAYPRVESASFTGGFLDGVRVDFSPNLNAFIGGRGSGKSTALIAVRAALGADLSEEENPDEPGRMPDSTTVVFFDRAGARRTVERTRGGTPCDPATGDPIRLELADMGQGAAGRLARDYTVDPGALRNFLDAFVDLESVRARQVELLEVLSDNGTRVRRDSEIGGMAAAKAEVKRLEGSMTAAQTGNLEELARYAVQLTAERALLAELDQLCARLCEVGISPVALDLPRLAAETGTDLGRQPVSDFLGTEDGVDALLVSLANRRAILGAEFGETLHTHAKPLLARVQAWKDKHTAWQAKMGERQLELEKQGLKVQAGEIVRVANQLDSARRKVRELSERSARLKQAESERVRLLKDYHGEQDREHMTRKTTLRAVVAAVNAQSDGLQIHVRIDQNADDRRWCKWLTDHLGFRQPRVSRIAREVSPLQFSIPLRRGRDSLAALSAEGAAMLSAEQLEAACELRDYPTIFELETMGRDDRIRLAVSEQKGTAPRAFNNMSAGQQRSVLLSLLLSAERDEPLIVDQPEDHLDASYIARSVVGQLESAKERRQVIIATHSPNLTVLGDAELVVPMYASAGHAQPSDAGAVDRPATREHVCILLEGGREAYRRRGARYGFDIRPFVH